MTKNQENHATMEKQTTNLTERVNSMYKHAIASGLVSSKTEFAEVTKIQPATLSRFLSGRKEPSRKTVEQMNKALGTPYRVEWLLFGTGEPYAVSDGVQPIQPTKEPPIGDAPLSAITMLVDEMRAQRESRDAQINELLTIINNLTSK